MPCTTCSTKLQATAADLQQTCSRDALHLPDRACGCWAQKVELTAQHDSHCLRVNQPRHLLLLLLCCVKAAGTVTLLLQVGLHAHHSYHEIPSLLLQQQQDNHRACYTAKCSHVCYEQPTLCAALQEASKHKGAAAMHGLHDERRGVDTCCPVVLLLLMAVLLLAQTASSIAL